MSKYHSKRTTIDGYTFASLKEAKRYQELKFMERAGVIKNLQMQVPFPLIKKSMYGREIKYIADFVYWEDDKMIVEDVKGYKTEMYRIKKRLMAETYNIKIKET